jgi:predicted nicotinamide N-methyase
MEGESKPFAYRAGRLLDSVITLEDPAFPAPLHIEQRSDAALAGDTTDGTNRRIWPTAIITSRYMCAHPDTVRGKRVLELGAGAGIVGLVCAMLGAEVVVITDLPGALPLIEANVQRNPLSDGRVVVMPCTWGDAAEEAAVVSRAGGRFDVVVACEVIYKQLPEVLQALAATQRNLLLDSGLSLVSYEFRGEFFDDLAYFDAANEIFDCETVSLRPFECEFEDKEDPDEETRYLYRYTPLRPLTGVATAS